MVIAGVLEHLTKQQVADELIEGTAQDLPKVAWAQLSMLHIQLMVKQVRDEGWRPDGNPVPPGAREMRDRRAPKFVTSQCYCIFVDNELIGLFLTRGYQNLRWVVLPVRQYKSP